MIPSTRRFAWPPFRLVSLETASHGTSWEVRDGRDALVATAPSDALVATAPSETLAALVTDALNAVDGDFPPPPSPDPVELTEEETDAMFETGEWPARLGL